MHNEVFIARYLFNILEYNEGLVYIKIMIVNIIYIIYIQQEKILMCLNSLIYLWCAFLDLDFDLVEFS